MEASPKLRAICDKLEWDCDTDRVLADPRNIVLIEGENAAMFLWRWPGIYEGHVLFTAKGKEADELARKMLDQMSWAMILAVTNQRHVGLFLRRMGFTFHGTVETIEGLSQMYQKEPKWAS